MAAQRALVTGATGFVGVHFCRELVERGDRAVGLSRSGAWPADAGIDLPLERVDLTDETAVRNVLRKTRPEAVYHLAGQPSVPDSFKNPDATWRANFVGTRVLLDAIERDAKDARILLVSTGQVHGQPAPKDLPIRETAPFRPVNPYAVSKAAADLLALRRAADRGLHVAIARPYNCIGPGQQDIYAVASFAKQIARLERSAEPRRMRVGRLDVARDFADVRDVVTAYRPLLAAAPSGSAFNVAAGVTRTLQSVLDLLLSLAAAKIDVETDAALLRRTDPDRIEVSCAKLQELVGWQPQIPIEKTLRDTLEHWRQRV